MQDTTLIQTFENSNFDKVCVITIDNVPWFVGKDICGMLGYTHSKKHLLTMLTMKTNNFFKGHKTLP